MASISTNDIARAIYLSVKGKASGEQSEIFQRTAEYLARKGLLSKTAQILRQLKKVVNDDEGKLAVTVRAKAKLSENEKKHLVRELGKRYAGKHIELEEHITPEILGGFKIEVEDEQIDLTLNNRINQLKEFLTKTG